MNDNKFMPPYTHYCIYCKKWFKTDNRENLVCRECTIIFNNHMKGGIK